MLMSRLRTDTRTDGNVKVEQYSAEAESAKTRKSIWRCDFVRSLNSRAVFNTNYPPKSHLWNPFWPPKRHFLLLLHWKFKYIFSGQRRWQKPYLLLSSSLFSRALTRMAKISGPLEGK